jgi:TetR/AcrR family transcriptional repressor of nem operon
MRTVQSPPRSGVGAPTGKPVRGRPRQFDADEVMGRVIELFWTKGYEATSISDIVEATGLNKSSLYNSFGSKDELFEAAIEQYLAMRTATINHVVRDGTQGLHDVLHLLELQQAEIVGDGGRRGCLAVNTTTELGLRDETAAELSRRFRDVMRTAIGAALDRAESAGEIEPGTARLRTETMLAFSLSLAVIARGGASAQELDDQFAAMRALIADWRLDRS